MENISLRQLYYFVAVAECGKVLDASNVVARSQSAVTTAVRDLERELDVALFDRHSGGVVLTSAGRELLPRAYRIIKEVEDATRSLKAGREKIEGSLRVGAKDTIAAYYLPASLTRFRQAHPYVDIDIREMVKADIEDSVRDGRIDLGIVALRSLGVAIQPSDGLRMEVLSQCVLHLWVGADHPFNTRQQISPAEIAAEPYIVWTRDEFESVTLARFAAFNLVPRFALRVSEIEAVRTLVAQGAGITVMPDVVYRPRSLEGGRVERLKATELFPGMTEICLLSRVDPEKNPAIGAFREFMQNDKLGFGAPRPTLRTVEPSGSAQKHSTGIQ